MVEKILQTNVLDHAISNNYGLARNNRFMVGFNLPDSLVSTTGQNELTMLCERTSWPSSYLQTFEYRTFKNSEQMPHSYSMYNVDMSFIVTNNHFAPNLFKNWQNLVMDKNTYRIAYKESYAKTITIYSIDVNERITRACKLLDAYPKTVSSMEFDKNMQNEYLKIEVKFTYRDFEEVNKIGEKINNVIAR